eukprot:4301791-Prymnesium_polylepis.4
MRMVWLTKASAVSSGFLNGFRTAVTTRMGTEITNASRIRMKMYSFGMRTMKPEHVILRNNSIISPAAMNSESMRSGGMFVPTGQEARGTGVGVDDSFAQIFPVHPEGHDEEKMHADWPNNDEYDCDTHNLSVLS